MNSRLATLLAQFFTAKKSFFPSSRGGDGGGTGRASV